MDFNFECSGGGFFNPHLTTFTPNKGWCNEVFTAQEKKKKITSLFHFRQLPYFYFPSQGQGEEGQQILEHLLKYAFF